MKSHVKYAARRQNDGQYAVLMKNMDTNEVSIESLHDSFDEAQEKVDELNQPESRTELPKFFDDLYKKLK